MATLQEENSHHLLYLRNLHIFGRDPSRSDTLLSNADASQLHASIRWNGLVWEITDHSRNGTLLDGKRLSANQKNVLSEGQLLRFGPMAASSWRVRDLAPPCAMLIAQGGAGVSIALHGFHFLPDETTALTTVYLSATGQWMAEDETGSRVLQDGDLVTAGPQTWKFSHAGAIEITCEAKSHAQQVVTPVMFDFVASQNEEHIYLKIRQAQRVIDLGERTHHYCLLTLARQRIADSRHGMDVASQGWLSVEELATMLGLDVPHVNTQLFRSRNQIVRELPDDSHLSNVIERRRGEVRFGAFHFKIVRGIAQEAEFVPPLYPLPVTTSMPAD